MSLKGKRIVVLAEDMYADPELWYPYYRLLEEGAQVLLVGPEAKEYKSKVGYPVKAQAAASAVSAADFDAVIVPGGFAPSSCAAIPRCSIWCEGSLRRVGSWQPSATRPGCPSRPRS